VTPLRDYQVRALEQVRDQLRSGKRAVCCVLPTGAGKTRIGAEMALGANDRARRTLWLAHRNELVQQAAERIRAEGIGRVGVIKADVFPDPGALVQVASVQTLLAQGKRPEAELVVFDEAHHYVSSDWGALAQHYSGAWRIGLTATPERGDGKPLGDLFQSLVAPIQVAELTERGFLVPCHFVAPKKRISAKRMPDPVSAYLGNIHARSRRSIFFANLVEQAEEYAARLQSAGIRAACISADTDDDVRADALRRFARGDIQVLTNVFVLTEGTDLPPAEVCVLARGFGHASTYLQAVGRVLRPSPETGKQSALVLDLCGVSRTHGVPADERKYSLDGKAIQVFNVGVWGRFESMGKHCSPNERSFYVQQLRIARARGFKPGWAVMRFKSKFGRAPWERGKVVAAE